MSQLFQPLSPSKRKRKITELAQLQENEEPLAPPQDDDVSPQITLIHPLDILLSRFAHQLTSASANRLHFSFHRFGILLSQLPEREQQGVSDEATTPDNMEDRLFMCLQSGSYSVERTFCLFQELYRPRGTLQFRTILEQPRLMTYFIEMANSIYVEARMNAGLVYTKAEQLVAMETQRKGIMLNVQSLFRPAAKETISDVALEAMIQTIDLKHDRMDDTREVQHFILWRKTPLYPIHHLLRLTCDAALVQENRFLKHPSPEERRYLWDVPENVPADGLALYLQGPLFQSMHFCLSSMDNKRGLEASLRWILAVRSRRVLFANWVALQYFYSLVQSRQTSIRSTLLRRIANESVNLQVALQQQQRK